MPRRPPKYYLKSQHVLYVLEDRITSGRLRQIARLGAIGFLEADSIAFDGMKPEKETRYFSEDDIQKVIAGAKRLTKAVREGKLVIGERLTRVRESLKSK